MLFSQRKNNKYKLLQVIVLFAILSVFFVFPLMMTKSIYLGDDLPYHINRIQELTMNLKHGNWYPYLYTYRFHGVPFLLGTFYPQLTLLPFALISLVTGNYVIGIYAGIAFYTFIAMLAMYYVSRKLDQSRTQAVINATVFSFSACRVYDIFPRFALGESIAMTFIVIVIYGLYAIMRQRKGWIALGFGLSLIMLTHVLSTFLIVLILVVEFLVLIKGVKDWQNTFVNLIKSVILFFCSSAIYVVPFLSQELFQKYGQPTPQNLVWGAQPLNQLFDNTVSNNLLNGYLLKTNQGMGIGIVLLIVIFWGIIKYSSLKNFEKACLLSGFILTLMATQLFPWRIMMKTPLDVMQYPTRFLPFATAFLSLISGKAVLEMVGKLVGYKRQLAKLALAMLLVIGPWLGSVETYKESMASQSGFIAWGTYQHNRKYDGNSLKNDGWYWYLDQYTPTNAKKNMNMIFKHVAKVDGKRSKLANLKAIPNGMIYHDKILQNKRNITLPVVNYRNLEVFQHGKVIAHDDNHGLIHLKKTSKGSITVKHVPSLLDKGSMAISIITWCGLIMFAGYYLLKRVMVR